MSKGATTGKSRSPKKEVRAQLVAQLRVALPGLREMLGEKKFEKRLRQAAKVLTTGIAKNALPRRKRVATPAPNVQPAPAPIVPEQQH